MLDGNGPHTELDLRPDPPDLNHRNGSDDKDHDVTTTTATEELESDDEPTTPA